MGKISLYNASNASDKAERREVKALLRQLLPEINYTFGYAHDEVRKAGISLILAEAAEIVRDYNSARSYYEEVTRAAANLEGLIGELRCFHSTLADLVHQATERAQEGLRSVEMKEELANYKAIRS